MGDNRILESIFMKKEAIHVKLKAGTRLEEREGKEVFLVLGKKEILLTGLIDQIVSRLYGSEMTEDELEESIPGAQQMLPVLKEWIE